MGESLLTDRPALVRDIAREVGTPAYVYDAAAIRRQYQALDAALERIPHRIYYSVKANGNLAILGLMRSLGAGADIVSVGELARVQRAGFDPRDVVFSGVGKTADELARALDAGVGVINVESGPELELLERIARGRSGPAPVGIRVNPDVPTATHPYTQTGGKDRKFGVPFGEVPALVQWMAGHPALELVGVGMHIGSQIAEAGPYRAGAERLAELVAELRGLGVATLRHVDVGGGIGIRYLNEDALSAEAFAGAVAPLAEATGLPLALDPGRFVAGNAGILLTRCLYRKQAGEKDFAIVDAGMNDLLRPSLYGAGHDVWVVPGTDDLDAPSDSHRPVDVVGPVCESGDFLALARDLPGAVPGALLAVLGTGAYGFTMASTYNSRPRGAEVMVDGERWAVIREREHVDDLMRGEHTLDQLDAGAWRGT